ncbi:UPF0102 protein [Leminorella grimontii]|uniref:UPF0102 protein SOASR030_25410 n=1 Tax=Leminorella grimontii TaxID=82981 RepID=A0AAV5N635_9GAMM|nr:YraN family protein [Leminorella grimontii]GKX56429.1 UPF0102 protein [Leminorella grimontii]GKX59970.1 UPF0102 protein [Leminorella grimontii]VFS61287.1 Uncharacterised protein family UPF0102 [Leminorella grimontii]
MDSVPNGSANAGEVGEITHYGVGTRFEGLARRHLERSGLRFIAANVKYRGGELDLIMQDGGTWVFVEVRYRRHARYGHALESIDLRKRRRLLYAASRWLHGRSLSIETADCRFDVLAITGNQLQWLTNAFDANGDA